MCGCRKLCGVEGLCVCMLKACKMCVGVEG